MNLLYEMSEKSSQLFTAQGDMFLLEVYKQIKQRKAFFTTELSVKLKIVKS